MLKRIQQRILTIKYLSYRIVLSIDTITSMVATVIALLLTNHYSSTDIEFSSGAKLVGVSIFVSLLAFIVSKSFRGIIRHTDLRDITRIIVAVLIKSALVLIYTLSANMLTIRQEFVYLMQDSLFTFFGLVAVRVLMVLVYDLIANKVSNRYNVLIYGISPMSLSLSNRLEANFKYNILGFYIYGEKYRSFSIGKYRTYYFNDEKDFKYITSKLNIKCIVFPDYESVQYEQGRLTDFCLHNMVKMMVAPPIDTVDFKQKKTQIIQEIKIEDLLGREQIDIDVEKICMNLKDKVVMVTGAAGSIGSELCRQLSSFGVRKLVLYDAAETPMHQLGLDLKELGFDNFESIVSDVRLKSRLKNVFVKYRPDIVFHAAAYKHVPLMESNPGDAVSTNVMGTKNVADLCVEFDVQKMIMISTDKAVNPTNVMGASKRIAEIYVQSLGVAIKNGERPGVTKFITTRFGNVLGSNGSVIPRFMDQIKRGGPVTVTHPEITRFFMTIPEACKLVLEAATLGDGNEIFVFDMGRSVKIIDLATKMIELSGLVPNKDIQIEFTGLRPGEKLYEEVLADKENTLPTSNKKILIAKVREYEFGPMSEQIAKLVRFALMSDMENTVIMMKRIVPEFISARSKYEKLDKS